MDIVYLKRRCFTCPQWQLQSAVGYYLNAYKITVGNRVASGLILQFASLVCWVLSIYFNHCKEGKGNKFMTTLTRILEDFSNVFFKLITR